MCSPKGVFKILVEGRDSTEEKNKRDAFQEEGGIKSAEGKV